MQAPHYRLAVSSITTVSGFEALEREWDDLLANSQQSVYFLRHRWNALWWRHHAPANSELRIITCRDACGSMVGAVPLYVRRHRGAGPFTIRELAFVGMGIPLKTSEYLDVIARRGFEQVVARAIADHLKHSRDWDRVRLTQVPSASTTLSHFVVAMNGRSGRVKTTLCDRAPYIDTDVSWEAYKSSLGRSMRRNVEYYARRLLKTHNCEFALLTSAAEFDHAFDAFVRLHQARWHAAGQPGSFSNPGLEPFLREVMRENLRDGRLRFWTLKIDGTIEAALVGFLENGTLHYFQKGFNPAYAGEDIGTAILGLCLRACFDDPAIKAFDFMGGGAAYKDRWARAVREMVSCEIQRTGFRGRFLDYQERAASTIRETLRSVTPTAVRVVRREWLRGLAFRRALKTANNVLNRVSKWIVLVGAEEVPLMLDSILGFL